MTLSRLFYGLLAVYFLVGMHVIFPTPGGSGLYLSFNTIGWLIVSILISVAAWKVAITKQIYLDRFIPYVAIAFILLLTPLFYPGDHTSYAIPRVLGILGGLLFWLSLNQFYHAQKHCSHILVLIVAAALIEAIISLCLFSLFEKGDWHGYDPTRHRPHGALLQPNVTATLLATGILVASYLLVEKTTPKRLTAILWPCVALAPFIIAILQSRVALLSCIIGIGLLVTYLIKQHVKRTLTILTIIISSFIIGNVALNHSNTVKRDADIYSDGGERKEIYSVSLRMITEKPFIGYGYGNFQRAYLDYHNKVKREDPTFPNPLHRLGHPHNEILYWVIEGGIIALIAFVILACAFIWLIRNIAAWHHRFALLSLISPIVLHNQTSLPFYMSLSHWLILILLIWYIKQQANKFNFKTPVATTFIMQSFAFFNAIIFVPFFMTTLHTNLIVSAFESTGYQHIHWLNKIVNPLPWKRRIELNTHSYILLKGLANNNHHQLTTYIVWAEMQVKHTPRVALYNNIILSYHKMNKVDLADQVKARAKIDYPMQEEWGEQLYIENVY